MHLYGTLPKLLVPFPRELVGPSFNHGGNWTELAASTAALQLQELFPRPRVGTTHVEAKVGQPPAVGTDRSQGGRKLNSCCMTPSRYAGSTVERH